MEERWLSIQAQSWKVITLTLLTLTFHFQIEVFFGIKQQKLYRIPYSILTYPALRCNLDVFMERISTLYILSLPMLLRFTNGLTYTMLTLDCKSSYVHLRMLKHVELHCSISVFSVVYLWH